MQGQRVIPIHPDPAGDGLGARANTVPLLHELRHALERLLASGGETTIDLGSLPMGPADAAGLEQALGQGELEAHLEAIGPSTIRETAYPGVWWVTHHNQDGQVIAQFLEVSLCPAILRSQLQDVQDGLEALSATLSQTAPSGANLRPNGGQY